VKGAAATKLFAVLAICTVYFTVFSRLGAFAYEAWAPNDGRLGPGTAVGPVSLDGMTPAEARQVVADRVNEWKATASIPIQYQEKTAELPADMFQFRLEESTKRLADRKRMPLFVIVDLEKCLEAASAIVPSAVLPSLDVKRLGADLEELAAGLQAPSSPLDLVAYVSLSNTEMPVVSQAAVAAADPAIARWLSSERRVTMKAKQLFSFGGYIKKAGPTLSDEAAGIIASAVYKAVLATNFTIAERYTSRALPEGVPLGFEAAIDGGRDLEWFNPNSTDYTLTLRYDGRNVRAAISGLPFSYQYIIRADEVEQIEPRTVVQYDPRLAPGETKVKEAGRPGLFVKVVREVRDGARLVRKETVSEDFYPPAYTIEVRGLEIDETGVGQNGGDESENSEPTEQPGSSTEESNEENTESKAVPKEDDGASDGGSAPSDGDEGETETSGGDGEGK